MPGLLRPTLLANQYPALHGLRVLAILSIVQLHITIGFGHWGAPMPSAFHTRSTSIWFGMDLFFLLSGFLIGSMLLRDDDATRPRSALRFWARRAFRIVPLYYVVLAVLAFAPLTHPVTHAPLVSAAQRAHVGYEFLYLTNYLPTRARPVMVWAWSLCVEEHFYLVVPLVLAAVTALRTPARRLGALVALWASGVVLRGAYVALHAPMNFDALFHDVYPRSHLRYDILVAGLLVAELQQRHAARVREALARWWVRAAAWALVAGCFALLLWPPRRLPEATLWTLWWGVPTALMYGPLVLLLVNRPGILGRVLGARPFLVLATFGYGVYLVHIPVADVFAMPLTLGAGLLLARAGLRLPLWLLWGAAVALTWALSTALAYALHLVVEKPALALRDRLVPGRA